jgi:hypothetical protein
LRGRRSILSHPGYRAGPTVLLRRRVCRLTPLGPAAREALAVCDIPLRTPSRSALLNHVLSTTSPAVSDRTTRTQLPCAHHRSSPCLPRSCPITSPRELEGVRTGPASAVGPCASWGDNTTSQRHRRQLDAHPVGTGGRALSATRAFSAWCLSIAPDTTLEHEYPFSRGRSPAEPG